MPDPDVRVRAADRRDVPLILSFVRKLAEFAGHPEAVLATEETLETTLFGEPSLAEVLFAEVDGRAVGFALYFQSYSSWLAGPCLWLEDLYVYPDARGRGVGSALMSRLAAIARERNCGRIDWVVNQRNERGIAFYRKHGAEVGRGQWVCRANAGVIENLAGSTVPA